MEMKKEPQVEELRPFDDDLNSRLRQRQKFFKPISLRSPILSILLVVTLVLIGLVEFACRRLPSASNRGVIATLKNQNAPLLARQDVPGPTTLPGTVPILTESTTIVTLDGQEQTVVYELSLAPAPTPEPPPSCSNTTCVPQATSAAESVYLKVGTRTIQRQVTSPGVSATPDPVFSPIVSPGDPGIIPGVPSTAPNVVVTTAPPAPLVTQTLVGTVVDASGNSVLTTVMVETTSPVSTPRTTTPAILSTKSSLVSYPSGSQTTIPGSTVVVQGNTIVLLPSVVPVSGNTEEVIYVFSMRDYIIGAFVPTIIAVLFTLPWGIIDSSAKEMEPFVRLAMTEGTSARFSLSLNYPGDWMIVAPFKSLFRGHWIIFLTSSLSLISLALAPLASETVFIALQGTCNADTDGNLCLPSLSVYPAAARVLQSILAVLALLLLILIIAIRRRQTGVYANPFSLAAIATLFHHPQVLDIFRNVPPNTREKELVAFLAGHNYGLGHYQQHGATIYGVLVDPKDAGEPEGYSYINLNAGLPSQHSPSKGWVRKLKRGAQVATFALCLVALTAGILLFRFTSTTPMFEKFMNSQSFGVRFVFTTFGVLIRLFWDYARTAIHKHEPYYNLKKGAPASLTVLLTPSPNPLPGVFRAIGRFALFPLIIDLSTILCDPLTVALSNVPFSSGTTYNTFIICVWIAVAILGFMLFTLLVVLIRIGRFGGEVEVPETIAGKMNLLAGSHMVESFKGLGDMDRKERDSTVRGWGLNYKIGRAMGVDGIVRHGVDFEEFVERRE